MEQTDDRIPFWLVWNPIGNQPQHRHDSLEEAETEAKRLARNNPGCEFFVLRPVSITMKNDIVTRRFQPSEADIAF